MTEITYNMLIFCFRMCCWLVIGAILCYWIYLFSLDEDRVLADYKTYYDTPNNAFPVLSICLKNPFLETRLKDFHANLTILSYLDFIEGNRFSPEMMNVSFDRVILNLSNYVDEYIVQWRDGHEEQISIFADRTQNKNIFKNAKQIFVPSFAGFWHSMFYVCYALQVPHNPSINFISVQVQLKNCYRLIMTNFLKNRMLEIFLC